MFAHGGKARSSQLSSTSTSRSDECAYVMTDFHLRLFDDAGLYPRDDYPVVSNKRHESLVARLEPCQVGRLVFSCAQFDFSAWVCCCAVLCCARAPAGSDLWGPVHLEVGRGCMQPSKFQQNSKFKVHISQAWANCNTLETSHCSSLALCNL